MYPQYLKTEQKVHEAFSNQTVTVSEGKIKINSPYTIVLLEE